MKTLIVTDRNQDWPFEIPGATAITARRYLAEPESGREVSDRVLNLCRTGRYQGRSYYVSLLAEARGQRPLPEMKTVEDLKSEAFVRTLSEQLAPLVRETLHHDFANTGVDSDCAVTAACFLSRFTHGVAWAHLDIAGTASKSGEDKGATGRPVGLLAHFLARRAGVRVAGAAGE